MAVGRAVSVSFSADVPVLATIMQAVSRPLPPRARPAMAMTRRTDTSKLGVHVGGPTPPMSCSQVKSTVSLGDTVSTECAVSLADFARKYSKSLPLTVEAQHGELGGASERKMTVSAGDAMNIHFVRHTQLFSIKSLRSKPFNVPLNSSVQFGLLYDPNDNLEKAKQGFTYKKVSDQPNCPRLCVQKKAWKGKDKDISKNEILVLKKHLVSAKELKVFSVACNCEKTLPQECHGHFTTSPSATALHPIFPKVPPSDQLPLHHSITTPGMRWLRDKALQGKAGGGGIPSR